MPTFREDLHLGHKVTLIETDDLQDSIITNEKISNGAVSTEKLDSTIQDILNGIHDFGTVVVDELPTTSEETLKYLYLLRTVSYKEETTVLNPDSLYCNYDTINEYDEIQDESMADNLCWKLDIVHDANVRLDFSGEDSTVFSCCAIKESDGRLVVVSSKRAGLTLSQLANELSADNHELPWLSDADYLYVWIADQTSEDTLSVVEVEQVVDEVSYEKYVTIHNDNTYEWIDLGPAMGLEPESSVDEMWEEEPEQTQDTTKGLIGKEWMDAYHAYVLQALAGKQPILISGTNIKTINGQSLLGEGNLDFLSIVAANTLPTASASTLNKIYLVPSRDPDEAADNIKEEWVTIQVATEDITYDGVDYPITNKGNFVSFLENGGTPDEAGPEAVGVVLLTSYDSSTANINNGYISPLGWEGKQIGENTYTWDNFSPKLGWSFTNINDHKTYVCTPNGWVDVDSLPISYDWELIGSTQVNLENYYTKAEINAMLDGATLEIDANNRLIITKGTSRFFTQLTELAKPASPTISVTTASVVTGNATFTATCATAGATIKYSLDEGTTWSNGPTVTVPSGFSNSSNNTTKTQVVKLKAIKNGEESDVASVTVTINPKVAAGSISIVRNGNNNDWSSQATITLTPSESTGATSSYSQDGGSTWTTFSSTVTLTASSSQSANTYQVKATKSDYVNADVVKSAAFTLNKKKFYYGMGDATLANEAAIKSLAGGGSEEKSTMAGNYSITAASTGKYIWFCGTGTLTSVTSGGFGVPMQAVAVVDGYNCYRSTSAVQETGTNTFIVA